MRTEWTKDRRMREAFRQECLQYGSDFVEIVRFPSNSAVACSHGRAILMRAWRNRHFLAQLYGESTGYLRLTVQRCALNEDGTWVDGITWDELMAIKTAVGFGDRWAVEVYPATEALVNVANMRHLFILSDAPPYAWRSGEPS